jgi:hypothetical protein
MKETQDVETVLERKYDFDVYRFKVRAALKPVASCYHTAELAGLRFRNMVQSLIACDGFRGYNPPAVPYHTAPLLESQRIERTPL